MRPCYSPVGPTTVQVGSLVALPWYYNDDSRRDALGCAKGGAALGVGEPGPFVNVLRILGPPQRSLRPESLPRKHFPHHPVHLRPRDPGDLSPPSLLRAQQKSSAQQAQGHVVMPALPGAGLVLVQPNVIPSPTPGGINEARALRPVGALGLFASAAADWVLNNRTIPIPATMAIATTMANALWILFSPLPAP